jgi:hypothetical protein
VLVVFILHGRSPFGVWIFWWCSIKTTAGRLSLLDSRLKLRKEELVVVDVTPEHLVQELAEATKKSFLKLFENGERYYYCALITSGEAFCPAPAAWSWEALEREAYNYPQYGEFEEAKDSLKWSYAESPYFCFGWDEYFITIRELFTKLPHPHDLLGNYEEWEKQYDFKMRIMELAMKQVDSDGIFALNQPRSEVYVNVEVMPPDYTNTERALRLNRADDIAVWLNEAAEPLP